MTFMEYLDEVFRQHRIHHRDLRFGQTAMNYLHAVRPELSNRVRGTDQDPFYDDTKFAAFCLWLSQEWE